MRLKTLFKKSFNYFILLAVGKLLTAAFFIILARILQPTRFGTITYFITIVQLLAVLTDLGLKNWYQKKMANQPTTILFSQLFTWRLLLYFVTVVIILEGQFLWQWLPSNLVTPIIIALFLESFISVSDAYYLSREQSFRLGWKLIVRNLLLFSGLIWIKNPNDYQLFFTVYNSSLAIVVFTYLPWSAINWHWLFTKKKLPTIKESLPYAAMDSLSIVYGKADSLIIENLRGSAALGIYGAAYRYLDAFNLLPQALFHNLFPIAAKVGNVSKLQLKKMVMMMTGLGIVIAGGVLLFSNFLTVTLLGESYAQAGHILRLFTPVIVLFFANAPLNTVIQSSDKIKKYLPPMLFIVSANVILNLLLVYQFGIVGAVWAMLMCELGLMIVNWRIVKTIR